MSVQRINPGPRMSKAVVHGDTVYLAGITADDTSQDVKAFCPRTQTNVAAGPGPGCRSTARAFLPLSFRGWANRKR